ncbi:MAG: hypothetical protein DWQ36_21700 [Acidobacteria bacterium]|nr:MAG: hypothetical protein DWQ30_09350 [Acidobacteriota bacterium]REK01119.1 MAG: hypothetical protein DWQ36_21700 [Acidobacteriota bacterium]
MTWRGDRARQTWALVIALVAITKAILGILALPTASTAGGMIELAAFAFVLVACLIGALVMVPTSPVLASLLAVLAAAYSSGIVSPWWRPQLVPIELFLPATLWLLALRSDPPRWFDRATSAALGLCLAIFVSAAAGLLSQDVMLEILAPLCVLPVFVLIRNHRIIGLDPRVRALVVAILLPVGFLLINSLIQIPLNSGKLPEALDSSALAVAVNGIAGIGAINVARVAWREREAEMLARARIQKPQDFVNWGLEVFEASVTAASLEMSEGARQAFREIYAESGIKAARVPRVFVLVEDQLRTVMEQQAAMAVMAARWKGQACVESDDVWRSVRGHQIVKNKTPLCPFLAAPISREEAA